jgi:glycerol-3-phosphate acyltransferase PlsY
MSPVLAILMVTAAGYVSGATPFGYVAGRWKGIDIRQHGSGNIGATNVIRVLGKGIGIPVFLLDLVKGWLPVWVAKMWLPEAGVEGSMLALAAVLTGFAAVLGHMFTFWLGFRGGKGVATTAGVLLGVAPDAVAAGFVVWLLVYLATRFVSLASMLASVAVPGWLVFRMARSGDWEPVMLGFGVVVMVLVFVRHRSNIGRLIAGTEPKSGQKNATETAKPS